MSSSKNRVADLALMGGVPAFVEKLHVGRPNIGDREVLTRRFNEILDRRWLTNSGPCVQELEDRIAKMMGVRHCIAMCNATIALEIAVRALGMTGEVIVPSFTFVATAHCLQWQGVTPVFCDVAAGTHNLDPRQVEKMITPRTTGIIGVHVWGQPCFVDELTEIARDRGLKLLFDAAHAFGCSHRGRMIGNFGDAEVYSFHATKFFNTFEGGAVMTNNDELAAKIRLMTNFGFAGYDNVIYVGTNGKMAEVCAAMGLTGLESLDEFVRVNRRNHDAYLSGLQGIPGLRMCSHSPGETRNYQYIVLEIDGDASGISRDHILNVLWAENVLVRRYFFPGAHQMEPYRSYFPHSGLLLPETQKLCQRVLVLPTGTAVDLDDIAAICRIIRLTVENSGAISDHLSR